ncbi:MAG: pyridoxine 5'-phosphate synthase [Pseudomonadota bacterium]
MLTSQKDIRLGVNIDHVATLRNARGGTHPDPVRAALNAENVGADGITVHLREDRRHIKDDDLAKLMHSLTKPLNLEMAATEEMLDIALKYQPHACCLVPEKREELTTEGGLDVVQIQTNLTSYIAQLREANIRVSLFIDAQTDQIERAHEIGADVVELHTGGYCDAVTSRDRIQIKSELDRLTAGAKLAHTLGLEVHAGHGLNFETVEAIAAIPQIVELNIGHFLIGEAVFTGLETAVVKMKTLMHNARAQSEQDEE